MFGREDENEDEDDRRGLFCPQVSLMVGRFVGGVFIPNLEMSFSFFFFINLKPGV